MLLTPKNPENQGGDGMVALPHPALLEIKNLSVSFAPRTAPEASWNLRHLSLSLRAGETLALVGESGSGKSLTALSIPRLLASNAHHPTGEIRFTPPQGETLDLLQAPAEKLRALRGREIAMIFQEPMTSLNPLQTIEQQISEVLALKAGLTGEKARAQTLKLLREVEIDNPEGRLQAYPHQLSGGQRQRVMIAIALACNPALLIADEPTTALDVTVQAKILALLTALQRKNNMAILFITHDLHLVKTMAHRVAIMQNGEIVETGAVAAVFAQPQHAYTQKLLAAEPKGVPQPLAKDAPLLLETRGLQVSFPLPLRFFWQKRNVFQALTKMDLTLFQGETLGVVGESGSGKTTLGQAILRLIPSQGAILLRQQPIDQLSQKALRPWRKVMQIVFQDPYGALSPRMSVAEILAEGLYIQNPRLEPEKARDIVAKALEDVGLQATMMDRYPHEFSGGQRQRIALARALALEPSLLVLDEPTSALDRSVQVQIIELLRDLQKKRNLSYLFISHDLRVVRALAHRILVLKGGKIVEIGTNEAIFNHPEQDYTRELMAAAFHQPLTSPPALL